MVRHVGELVASMRLISWNMGCGGKQSAYRKTHAEAWSYLLDELRPDVALLQEALAPAHKWVETRGACVMSSDHNPDNGAVLFAASPLRVSAFDVRAHDAFVAAADVEGLRIMSLHLYPRSGTRHHGNLVALFDVVADLTRGHRFVVGGDINASRGFDTMYGGRAYQKSFDAIARRGFHECHFGLHRAESQTFWGHRAKGAYQLDHFFVDEPAAGKIARCEVVTTEDTRRLSDHSPVLLEVE